MGGGSVNGDQQGGQQAPATIYATAATAAYLRSIGIDPAKIPELNGKDILFVQKGDVTPGTAGTSSRAGNYVYAAVTGSPLGPNMTARSAEYFKIVIPNFIANAAPELVEDGRDPGGFLADTNRSALTGRDAQNMSPFKDNSVCVVAMPGPAVSPAQKFVDIAGQDLDPALATNVPGTTADWNNLTVGHELGHCADGSLKGDTNTLVLKGEVTGDRFANAQYPVDRDQAVKQARMDARALNGFGGLVGSEDGKPLYANSEIISLEKMKIESVMWSMWSTTPPFCTETPELKIIPAAISERYIFSRMDAAYAEAIDKRVQDHATAPYMADGNVDPRSNPQFNAMMEVNSRINLALGASKTGNETGDVNAKTLEEKVRISLVGAAEGGDKPVLNFAALNALNDSGAFKKGSPEAEYAENIIRIQTQYMPGMKDLPEYKEAYERIRRMSAPAGTLTVENAPNLPGDEWKEKTKTNAAPVGDHFEVAAVGAETTVVVPAEKPAAKPLPASPAASA